MVAAKLCNLQVLGITFGSDASEADPFGGAADALFVVHRTRLAARCAAANSDSSPGTYIASSCAWGGTAIVDATRCTGSRSQITSRLCQDAAVATGLQRGVQTVAAALSRAASSDAPGYTPVWINLSTTSPTLLSAWLLEYPVGYYVSQPATSNTLGGEELVIFSVCAELALQDSESQWLQLDPSDDPSQPSTLCSFSVPLHLFMKEQVIGDMIQAWCTRLGAVWTCASADASKVKSSNDCYVWRSPCTIDQDDSDADLSDQDEDTLGEGDRQTLIWQLGLLPWLRKQEGVVLDQVAL